MSSCLPAAADAADIHLLDACTVSHTLTSLAGCNIAYSHISEIQQRPSISSGRMRQPPACRISTCCEGLVGPGADCSIMHRACPSIVIHARRQRHDNVESTPAIPAKALFSMRGEGRGGGISFGEGPSLVPNPVFNRGLAGPVGLPMASVTNAYWRIQLVISILGFDGPGMAG